MLTADATRVFLFLSERPDATVEEISDGLAMRMADVEQARSELESFRLVGAAHVGSESLVATSPDIALAALVHDKERSILDLQREVARFRTTLLPLAPKYREARGQMTIAPLVEVLDDVEVAQKLLLDLGRQVSREVLMMNAGPGSKVEVHEASDEKDLELLKRGVVRRDIWHDRRRDHLASRRSVARLSPHGSEFRTLPVVPCRVFIFDRQIVLFARDRNENDYGLVVVREPELVRIMVDLFEAAWQVATPFVVDALNLEGKPAEGAEDACLSATQRTILRGLAAGFTDETLANRLGISVRTTRRHISQLFELLGAESRFQAGALAMQRGWL